MLYIEGSFLWNLTPGLISRSILLLYSIIVGRKVYIYPYKRIIKTIAYIYILEDVGK